MARRPIEPDLFTIPEDDSPPRLLGSRCEACGSVFHPRRPVCLSCHGRGLRDCELTGHGVLYACTRVQMPLRPGRRESRSYWVAQVDLDEGPRVQGLLAPEVEHPEIGMRLGLALETLQIEENGNEVVVSHFCSVGAP